MEENKNQYINYQNMVSTVTTALSDIAHLCEQMKMEENRKEIERIQKKLSGHTFSVGIMGEFKRGKSTVINSLLEKEIMPADILPCSATMNRVTYDLHPHVQLKMRDGSTKDIPVEELANYVTKLNAENESRAAEVDEAIVYYPCRFCQNGVDIVDTPGLNDDERMNRISEEVIPKLDAVIMVLTPDNPFSMSEAEFVRNKLMTSDLGRLIFVVNKIDTIRRAADRQRVVESIREKIQKSVMEKMANLYGEGSEEYNEAVKKIGKIRVYPLSALDALDGKIEGDQDLIEKSGTLEFEAALTKMLTEDRGALELSVAVTAIARAAVEITKTVAVRKQALEMNASEFAESQQQALAEIDSIREKKKLERKRLRENARQTKQELCLQISNSYGPLQATLKEKLDAAAAELDPKQLQSKEGLQATAEQLSVMISEEFKNEISLITERVKDNLDRRIGKDMAMAGAFVSGITDKLDKMNAELFMKRPGVDGTDLLASGIQTFAMYTGLYGVGGIISGYKSAGVLGALTGGGISAAASLATIFLLAELSIVGLPLAIIAGVTGTMAGKFATEFIFRGSRAKKEMDRIKTSIGESVDQAIADLQARRELENWCEDLVERRYSELISGMEEETERLLRATEASMDEIKQDITENDMQRKQLCERFDKILASVNEIVNEDIAPVADRVRHVLENT